MVPFSLSSRVSTEAGLLSHARRQYADINKIQSNVWKESMQYELLSTNKGLI